MSALKVTINFLLAQRVLSQVYGFKDAEQNNNKWLYVGDAP